MSSLHQKTAFVEAVYKRDALSFVNEVYADFTQLLGLRRGANETFKDYEARFSAQVGKLNAHGPAASLHESLLGMMLLAGSSVDDAQRIPILSSVGGRESVTLEQDSDSVIAQIKYEDVASVLRQCDRIQASSSASQTGNNTVNSNSASYSSNYRGGSSGGKRRGGSSNGHQRSSRPRMSPQELRNYKLKCFCKSCGKLGHWASDHNNDGTVKDNLPSIEPANGAAPAFPVKNNTHHDTGGAVATQRQDQPKDGNNVIAFCATLYAGSTNAKHGDPTLGPLVDDGAPHSAIGVAELSLLTGIQCKSHQSPLRLDPKPDHLAEYDWWQYGKGSHSSGRRRILGSVNITAISDSGRDVLIRHLVVAGSSQWLIGRNISPERHFALWWKPNFVSAR